MTTTASLHRPVTAEVVQTDIAQWIWLHDKSGNRIDIHADDTQLDMIARAIAGHFAEREKVRAVLGEAA